MGQKVHPLGFRVGITRDHTSYWFSKPKNYSSFVQEDIFIRDYINKRFPDTSISIIEIKRKFNFITINISTSNPGSIIGSNGIVLKDMQKNLSDIFSTKFSSRDFNINIIEIVNPDSNAKFLAQFISQQLEKRAPFRKVMKTAILKAQKSGLKGIKIQISGRLNGAEIARTEWVREGQVPLHTLRANIDYCSYKAQTLYGILGIKVWVNNS